MKGKGRILVVDDEEVFLNTTAELLRLRGYQCDCASDATEAAGKLRENQYDLLIADIKMPGNLGLELITQAREISRGMPVILVTGFPSLSSAVDAIQLSVAAYLIKPFDFDELLPHVQRCVQRSQIVQSICEARQQLADWAGDLGEVESLLGPPEYKSASEPVSAFVAVNLKNVATTLSNFSRLTESLTEDRPKQEQWEFVASTQLHTAYKVLTEAIDVLEHTKTLFKSKLLGRLRRKLQVVVDGWTEGWDRPSD